MTQKPEIKLFDEKLVRTVWDDEQEKWYFSVVDVVEVLTDSPNPRKYWSVLKNRLLKEGSQLTTNCSQLKMLSRLLNSDIAIEMNIAIMRTFIALRQLITQSPINKIAELQTEMKELKAYIEEVFTDYNDINEDTRMQMELINQSLAELHTDRKLTSKHRKKIGFITEK